MIKYCVMSQSGKSFHNYKTALEIVKESKFPDWAGNLDKIHYQFKEGKTKKEGTISIGEFYDKCIPQNCYKVGYHNQGSFITDDIEVAREEQNTAFEEGLDEFFLKPIKMSKFELELLPEFEGF